MSPFFDTRDVLDDFAAQLDAARPSICLPDSADHAPVLVGRPGIWDEPADAFICGNECKHGGRCVRVFGHDGQCTTAFCEPWTAVQA